MSKQRRSLPSRTAILYRFTRTYRGPQSPTKVHTVQRTDTSARVKYSVPRTRK